MNSFLPCTITTANICSHRKEIEFEPDFEFEKPVKTFPYFPRDSLDLRTHFVYKGLTVKCLPRALDHFHKIENLHLKINCAAGHFLVFDSIGGPKEF